MCGIAGVIKWTDGPAPWAPPLHERTHLEQMLVAIGHRGPDGAGMYLDPRLNKTAALLHTRLAIVDLPGGTQPMGNEDGQVQVVFNGEIYNHAELRKELTAAGHVFKTDHSDTEVLVHGWEEWGEKLPARLVGMFAFAVWDARRETFFMARDRMGQKPLFYATLEDGLVFGSSIPAVLAWPEVPRRVPREQVALYLWMGYVPMGAGGGGGTIYRDVTQVLPGHWVRVRRDVVDGGCYWKPEVLREGGGNVRVDRAAAEEELTRLLGEAVRSQLMADVPVACFLSGGLDSSIIAMLMQAAVRAGGGGQSITTVSVGFAETGYDETAFAREVADRIGSKHVRLEVNAGRDVMGTLEHLMHTVLGQPFADSSILPTHLLSKAAREIAPVALSGDGGDELFGGYDRYRAMTFLAKRAWLIRLLPGTAPGGDLKKRERWRRLKNAAAARDLGDRYAALTELFDRWQLDELVPGSIDDWLPPAHDPVGAEGFSPYRYGMARDQADYLPGDVLWKVDGGSMACALEVRSPLLDHRVVEFANRQPTGLASCKRLLKGAFGGDLPASVLGRKKQGFAVPIGQWFRGPLKLAVHELLRSKDSFCGQCLSTDAVERLLVEHEECRRDHTHRLFSLVMLELWWRAFPSTLEG